MAMSVCPARRRRQRRRRRRSRTRSKRPRHVSTNRTRTPILHHVFFFGSDGPRFAAHSSPRTKRLNDTQDRPPTGHDVYVEESYTGPSSRDPFGAGQKRVG